MLNRTFVILTLVALSAPARADDLVLTDGRFIDGVKIEKVEGGYKIRYENGDIVIPAAMVRECLIADGESFVPRNDEEKAQLEKGFVPFEGKWVKKAKRDSEIAKRRESTAKKIEELREHRLWRNRYIDKGKDFIFEYTIDPEIFGNLAELMDTYYDVFTKVWKIRRPSKLGPLKVCFYHDYETFLQVAGTSYGVLGYYRHVPPLELNFFYDRLDPEFTIEVMFHEANHYLTHLIDIDFMYPHCINEAMAEYYGASKWDPEKKKMTVGGLLEGRLTEVKTDIEGGEWKKLEPYLKNELGYDDYTWGWTFVHFMMESKKYEKKFRSFFAGLARDRSVKTVPVGGLDRRTVEGEELLAYFQKKMGIKDLTALEKEWHAYIDQDLKLTSHRGYEDAARSALGTGQSIKAERYFKKAIEKGSKNPTVYTRYAGMLGNKGKVDEAIDLLEQALTFDPLSADVYAALGRMTKRKGGEADKKEAERLFRLAKEIDPDRVDLDLEELLEKAVGASTSN